MLLRPWDFPGKSTGVGCHFLLQRIFPTQGSNLGLPHRRQMLCHLSHQGSLIFVNTMPIWDSKRIATFFFFDNMHHSFLKKVLSSSNFVFGSLLWRNKNISAVFVHIRMVIATSCKSWKSRKKNELGKLQRLKFWAIRYLFRVCIQLSEVNTVRSC